METVRISAAGFPSRWTYEDFIDRYDLLAKLNQIQEDDLTATAKSIITNWIKDEDKCRYGRTQLFFRAGQVAYLEQIRSDLRRQHIIVVQSLVRRHVYQRRYQQIRTAVLGIQRYARGMMARQRAQIVREERAAVVLQRHVRGWLQRTKYRKSKTAIVRLQAICRGYLARDKFRRVLDNYKATVVQRYCRGYLARQRFSKRLQQIIMCQSAVRRFLARRRYRKLRAEARTVAGMQKKSLGMENKIISMQQKLDEYRAEIKALKRQVDEIPELRSRVESLKKLEAELKPLRVTLQEKTDRIIACDAALTTERDEKMQLVQERDREQREWQLERHRIEENLAELQATIEGLQATAEAAAAQERHVSAFEPSSELNEVYQRAVNEKEVLETENTQLREEVRKLQIQLNNMNNSSLNYSSGQSHSLSTTASSHTEEDVGYGSAKNTLELRREEKPQPSPRNTSTATILKMRKLFEEQKKISERLQGKLDRYESLKRPYNQSLSPEDRIRLSELEVEHEKLAKDYESLRMGISRGVETQILNDHYVALQEELRRRKEESVQLKTVLAEQSQSMRSLNDNASMLDRFQDYTELLEAFQAQKLVNRQLESELTAITEEHNVALREFSRQQDDSCLEKGKLEEILYAELQKGHQGGEESVQSVNYLRHELESVTADYATSQEELNEMRRSNQILMERLRDHGLNDSILLDEGVSTMALVNKRPQTYQGIFKYLHEDEGKIIQRLVTEYTPQIAITLPPALPAYIFLMCVRYTDLMNADQNVRTLLSNIITQAKKVFQQPNTLETRLVGIVNMLRLYNLLRQYGGLDDGEFTQLNTETQNRQQLKNFDLTEYRHIILAKIVYFYQVFVRQAQFTLKTTIVAALLEFDETTRGKKSARKSVDAAEQVADPAALVRRLNQLYEQLQHFGLGKSYVVQVFYQLFYYVAAVSLNNLMLRSDLCTWRTGMKIKYNAGVLKSWAVQVGMPSAVLARLDVLFEVSTLLQLRKSDVDTDVKSIVDMCKLLSSTQILKIIKMYRSDDAEPPITQPFLEALTKALDTEVGRRRMKMVFMVDLINCFPLQTSTDSFMVEEGYLLPLDVIYEHSDVRLDEIDLPAAVNLRGVLTKI